MNSEIIEILLTGSDASHILKTLFERANKNRVLTLGELCRKSGLSSKGYLSEVLRSRRIPSPNAAEALAEALGLSGLPSKYVRLLAERDGTKDLAKQMECNSELDAMRKGLHVYELPTPDSPRLSGFSMEVFCAFGLFQGKPSKANLASYFGLNRAGEIDQSLQELINFGFVVATESGFDLAKFPSQYALSEGKDSYKHLEILRESIYTAARDAATWFPRKAESYFESMVMSVRKSTYQAALQALKADMQTWESALETHDADTLIRINVQIYPCQR